MATGNDFSLTINSSLSLDARSEIFESVIRNYLETGRGKQLRLMVVGEAGQGKSTLVNALVGSEVANEGGGFESGTLCVNRYMIVQNDVNVEIIDTPGLGMDGEEDDVELISRLSDVGLVDLTLFCIRLDSTRIPTNLHKRMITTLTKVFGKDFWNHCLFVLTFSNFVPTLCPPDKKLDKFFSNRCYEIHTILTKTLQNLAKVKELELQVVPVGWSRRGIYENNPWALPDREDWFVSFWLEATHCMRSSAVSALLQVNRHRLDNVVTLSLTPQTINQLQNVNNDSLSNSYSGCATHGELNNGSSDTSFADWETDVEFLLKDVHNRRISWFDILEDHLKNQNSSFYLYVTEFAKLRGRDLFGVGHVAGFVEGFCLYFKNKRDKKKATAFI